MLTFYLKRICYRMKKLAIYGAGGFGKEVFCIVRKINETKPQWDVVGFFDDGRAKGCAAGRYGHVLGGMNELNAWNEELAIVVAVGATKNLLRIVSRINNPRVWFPNIIHPDAIFADWQSITMGQGNVVQRASAFSCDVTIGDFNVFNGSTVVGHDVTIGNHNIFMPSVRLSGGVKIGDDNFFGIASIVIQGLKVGFDVTLSAGSVLLTKPKDGFLYLGNPARKTEF